VFSSAPGHAEYVLPDVAGRKLVDLFGNPLSPGDSLGEGIAYLSLDGPASDVETVLGINR
jgi:hypothetical protein